MRDPQPRRSENYTLVRQIDEVSPSALFSTQIYAWGFIVYGVLICAGGLDRWASPAYYALRQVPGAPYTFGLLSVAAGIIIRFGCELGWWKFRNVGIWTLVVLNLVYVGGFSYAALHDPYAPFGPIIIHAVVAGHLMVLRRHRGRPPRP